MDRRITAVKFAVLAATAAGLIALGATAAHADESAPPATGGTSATPNPSPSPDIPGNNPWD